MSTDAQTKNSVFYVHKLRLEASEGARVEVSPAIGLASWSQGVWIVAKLVGATIAASAALVMVASLG